MRACGCRLGRRPCRACVKWDNIDCDLRSNYAAPASPRPPPGVLLLRIPADPACAAVLAVVGGVVRDVLLVGARRLAPQVRRLEARFVAASYVLRTRQSPKYGGGAAAPVGRAGAPGREIGGLLWRREMRGGSCGMRGCAISKVSLRHHAPCADGATSRVPSPTSSRSSRPQKMVPVAVDAAAARGGGGSPR